MERIAGICLNLIRSVTFWIFRDWIVTSMDTTDRTHNIK